jgi:hypothetical protein
LTTSRKTAVSPIVAIVLSVLIYPSGYADPKAVKILSTDRISPRPHILIIP